MNLLPKGAKSFLLENTPFQKADTINLYQLQTEFHPLKVFRFPSKIHDDTALNITAEFWLYRNKLYNIDSRKEQDRGKRLG